MVRLVLCVLVFLSASNTFAEDFTPSRCEVIPLPDHTVALQIDGMTKVRWHYGDQYPRPFFYPFRGPSGVSLTRMGHPGAQNHDHHRSIWFAHQKINGINFWADGTKARIRQKFWYRYRDGNDECVMASVLGWYDAGGKEVMEQDVVVALRPLAQGEHELELQVTMRPPMGVDSVTLNKTNFGLLAVRVSKTLSNYFGGGNLTSSEGAVGEADIFGKRARWMDYSGPVVIGTGKDRRVVPEGITYFDHPQNPRYPTHWHVRSDGWMGASFGMHEDYQINAGQSLTLRYLLYAHSGTYDADNASGVHTDFAKRPGFQVRKPGPGELHRQYEVERKAGQP